jgi:hypothetical protein
MIEGEIVSAPLGSKRSSPSCCDQANSRLWTATGRSEVLVSISVPAGLAASISSRSGAMLSRAAPAISAVAGFCASAAEAAVARNDPPARINAMKRGETAGRVIQVSMWS